MEKWRSCVGTLLLLLSPALQERALSAVQHSANQSVGDFDPSVQSRGLDPAKDPSNAGDNLPASSVVIEAPKAGDTLVSSASVALRVRVDLADSFGTRPCHSFGMRITAQADTSHFQLHRESLYTTGNPTLVKVEAVAPESGVWTLNAVCYCSFQSVTALIVEHASEIKRALRLRLFSLADDMGHDEVMRKNGIPEGGELSLRSISRPVHQSLEQALELLDGGHLEQARVSLNAADEALDELGIVFFKDVIDDFVRMIDYELECIAEAVVASHAVVILVARSEVSGRITMQHGCQGLLPGMPQAKFAGFGQNTWQRTLECLSAFVHRFPENIEARSWLSVGVQAVGGGEDSTREKCEADCKTPKWRQETRIAPLVAAGHGEDHEVYLSIIALAKHDDSAWCQVPRDHCLDRLRVFLATTIDSLAVNSLADASEILLVEYNPSPLGSFWKLSDAVQHLLISSPHRAPPIRVLTVTEAQHAKFHNPHGYDLLELHGKNVAARRARGEFILFTNPDDVWSEGLGALIGRRQLRRDVFYVTHRGWLSDHIPVMHNTTPRAMQDFISKHGFQNFSVPSSDCQRRAVGPKWSTAACKEGDVDEIPTGHGHDFDSKCYMTQAPGDFFLASRQAIHRIRGYPEIPHWVHVDGLILYVAAAHGLRQLVMQPSCSIYHQEHARSPLSKFDTMLLTSGRTVFSAILSAGAKANHRPEELARDGDAQVYASLELHRWNDQNWGLAAEEIMEVTLRASSYCWHAAPEAELLGPAEVHEAGAGRRADDDQTLVMDGIGEADSGRSVASKLEEWRRKRQNARKLEEWRRKLAAARENGA